MTESTAAAPTGLVFAHLSDPHLTSLQGVAWRELVNKRLLGYLSWRRKRRAEHRLEVLDALLEDLRHTRPEHLVITGDLTHIGLPREFHQARLWLDRLGDHEHVTVIPGNHDAYVHASWDSTYAHWAPFMQSDPRFRGLDDRGHDMFPTLRVRNGVAIIGLSSAVASAPFLATGTLGPAQRERFARLLEATAREGLFRVVLLHHPPRVEDEKWRKRLTDGRALCKVLGAQGAELILHGHGHRLAESGVPSGDDLIPVFGIPSASAVGARPGRAARYHIYRIRREDGRWSVEITARGYKADSGRFVQLQQHHLSRPVMSSTSR